MGKKQKSKKKWKNSNTSKKRKKRIESYFRTRRERALSVFNERTLDLWFHGDKDKINEFADFLISQEELNEQCSLDELDDGNYYEREIERLRYKEVNSVYEAFDNLEKIKKLEKKQRKQSEFKGDKAIAFYLNGKGKSKKFLNKDKYSHEIKKIAKSEKREIKEMKKLGYIKKNPSIDDELTRLKNANRMMSEAIKEIYHDAYTQKYFIDE